MKTIQVTDVAPHLPYSLKFIAHTNYKDGLSCIQEVYGVNKNNLSYVNSCLQVIESPMKFSKLILHPLSDLVKEIEVNGERFIPAELLCQIGIALGYIKDNAPTVPIDYRIIQKPFGKVLKVQKLDDWLIYFSFDEPNRAKKWIIDKLYEWHFDVDNLIEQGLAIDINTLKR